MNELPNITWKFVAKATAWYVAILGWELLTSQAYSTSPSAWRGLGVTIALVALASYRLAAFNIRTPRFFLFGCVAGLLLLPRAITVGISANWARGVPSVFACIQFTLAGISLGLLAWGMAQLRRVVMQAKAIARSKMDAALPLGTNSIPVDNSATEPPRVPLGIADLLLWITCIAIWLGFLRRFYEDKSIPVAESAWRWLPMILGSVSAGSGLFGVLLFVTRAFRGVRFPTKPGEFLLLSLGFAFILFAVGLCFMPKMPASSLRDFEAMYAINSAGYLISALVLISALGLSPPLWQAYLVWACATMVLGFLQYLAFSVRSEFALMYSFYDVEMWLVFSTALFLGGIVIKDLVGRRTYPWTNWLGIGAVFLSLTTSAINLVHFRFFYHP